MPSNGKPDAIVGVVSGPTVNIWWVHSLINLFRSGTMGPRFMSSWLLTMGPYIHTNRNQVQREFMQSDRTWLLSTDNDMVFQPSDVEALFAVADEKGPGIYAAPYLLEDSALAAGAWDEKVEKVYRGLLKLPHAPKRVGMVGMGLTLIHRKVFEDLGEDAFRAISSTAGEDVSFCWRACEAGYEPWLIPAANPGHFKSVVLFPDESVRNIVGDEVNLVRVGEELNALNKEMEEVA